MLQVIIKKEHGYLIASDNTLILDSSVYNEQLEGNDVLFSASNNKNLVIGIPKDYKLASLIRSKDLPKLERNKLDMDFLVRKFIRGLYGLLIKEEFIENDGAYPHFSSPIIVAYKDRCYTISKDGTIDQINECEILGEAKDVGYAIYFTSDHQDPLKTIFKIYLEGSKVAQDVSTNIKVMDTSYDEVKTTYYSKEEMLNLLK